MICIIVFAKPLHIMQIQPSSRKFPSRPPGYTIIELTMVITVVLGLIIVLYVQLRAYKRGSDRAACIQNIATVQRAVRSYGNLFEFYPGETVPGLKTRFIGGPGKFVEKEPECPDDGIYSFLGDTMPISGMLYMDCSIADHQPANHTGW